jgi:chemotaxis protein histidine kinase CheA
MAVETSQEQFRQDILALFQPEAEVWAGQIAVACRELAATPAVPRARALHQAIRDAVTNLGGSAATVGLPAIERLAFALLPPLDTLDRQETSPSPAQLAALDDAVAALQAALALLAPAAGAPSPPRGAPPQTDPIDSAPLDAIRTHLLLAALNDLHASRAASADQTLDALDALRHRLLQPSEQGNVVVDAEAVRHCLEEVAALDAEILAEATHRIPEVAVILALLEQGNAAAADLEEALHDVAHLQQAVKAAGASAILRLLQGLEAFLTIAERRRGSIPADRFAAVEAQLASVLPKLQEWTAVGRAKRAGVEWALRPRRVPPNHSLRKVIPV